MPESSHLRVVSPEDPLHRSSRFCEAKNGSHGSGLSCEIASDFSRLEELSSDWERLWQSDEQAEIFQTFAWARAWWQSYGRHFTLCSPIVFEGDKVIGILPLVKRGSIVQFLGTPEADYADVLCEEDRAREVLASALAALLASGEQWNECILQHLAKDSRLVRHCQVLPRDLRKRVKLVPGDRNQTILLRDNRDEIFNSLLGKHHTRRRQNKLKKAGRVTLRRLVTRSEAMQHLSHFFLHHTRRCALLGRKSPCAKEEYRQFLRALVDELDPNARLRFEALELDGNPFAWHFSFLVNGKFLLYQHTFDLDSWDYAPGEVLVSNLLQFAKDHVTREFDYGCGDEPYKARFSTHARETFSVYVESPGLRGGIHGLLRAGQAYFYPVARQIKESAKAHTRTFRLLRSIRISSSEVLNRVRQAKKSGALLRYWLHWTGQLFRSLIWNKEELGIFAWDGFVGPDGTPLPSFPCSGELEIKVARFGDLVDLATERPDLVVPSELTGFRQRLKKGDRAYIGRTSTLAELLAWTSDNTADMLTLNGRAPDRPRLVMYDCRNAPGFGSTSSYRQLLSVLRLEAVSRKLDLWIRGVNQETLRAELEHQGFLPACRMVNYKFLYLFRWTRLFQTKRPVAQASLAGAVGA